MQLHQIYLAGIVHHTTLGVLITQSQIAHGSFIFCGTTLNAGEDWRNVLYLHIKQKTWIEDLHFQRILWAQSFPAKVVNDEPTWMHFVHVKTHEKGHGHGYRWVNNVQELDSLALFHPLVKTLCEDVLSHKSAITK